MTIDKQAAEQFDIYKVKYLEDANDLAVTVNPDDREVILSLTNSNNEWMDIRLSYKDATHMINLIMKGIASRFEEEVCDDWLSELPEEEWGDEEE